MPGILCKSRGGGTASFLQSSHHFIPLQAGELAAPAVFLALDQDRCREGEAGSAVIDKGSDGAQAGESDDLVLTGSGGGDGLSSWVA